MTRNEIRKILEEGASLSNTGLFGETTIADQYKNANSLLSELNDIEDLDHDSEEYKDFAGQIKAQKANAVMSGRMTGANGLASIGSTAVQAADINDTSYYDQQLDQMMRSGNYNYGSYTQLNNDLMNQPQVNPVSYQDIRGMNNLQKAGSILSSTASGAAAGAQIGGLWGGIAGAAVGLAGGVGGVLVGNANARAKQDYYTSKAAQANAISGINYQAANNRIADTDSRYKMSRVVANGGRIERKRESIQDFASRVMRTPGNQIRRNSGDMVRTYEEGGVRIKIRRK